MNYAIILSGGVGTRLGLDIPKQYYKVNKKPIICYGLETMESSVAVDAYVKQAKYNKPYQFYLSCPSESHLK